MSMASQRELNFSSQKFIILNSLSLPFYLKIDCYKSKFAVNKPAWDGTQTLGPQYLAPKISGYGVSKLNQLK